MDHTNPDVPAGAPTDDGLPTSELEPAHRTDFGDDTQTGMTTDPEHEIVPADDDAAAAPEGSDLWRPADAEPPPAPAQAAGVFTTDVYPPEPAPLADRQWQTGRLFPEFEQERRTRAMPLYGYPIYDEPEPPPVETPRTRSRWGTALIALLAGVAGALATFGLLSISGALDGQEAAATPPTTQAPPPQEVVEVREIITEGDASTVAIAVGEKVVPSIVTVEIGDAAVDGFDAFGSGSGVVVSRDGLIVTNHHVIDNADESRVVFQDGRIYEAEIVGSDPLTDLAVLRIQGSGFDAIEYGQTLDLSIGDRAIAVGNPLGLRGGASLTVGVVSAFDREVQVGVDDWLFGMLQTDAPITQGSSGGALVDGSGRLIGITTAIGVSSAGAEGIGFAIPVELVSRITEEIIATGDVRHAFLGVQLSDSFEAQSDGAVIPDGALITGFAGDTSAAQTAGLEAGDRIIRYDTIRVATRDDLINGIRRYRVGDRIEIEVIRNGETIVAEITLGERPTGL